MAQNFQADVRIGKVAEEIFLQHISKPGTISLQITGRWKWWDVMVFDKTNTTYEIKNDSWIKKTGNLCIELWSHKKLEHLGWIHYSSADYLVYFMSATEYLQIPMQTIRDYIAIPENMKGKRKVSGWTKGNPNVQNVLIPYTEFTTTIHKIGE